MKVLLLNSPWIINETEYSIKSGTRWACIRKRGQNMPYFPFPYFMCQAKTYLAQAGFDAHVKDAIAEEWTREQTLTYVEQFKPDLLVVEAFTPSIFVDLEFCQEAKKRTGCAVALCGAHPTALTRDMFNNDFVDYVLRRDYIFTIRELCQALQAGTQDFASIPDLGWRRNGEVVINAERTFTSDIDQLPYPDRSDLPVEKYTEPLSKHHLSAKVVTTRGCPFTCMFCIEPFMYGKMYRKRPAQDVVNEIIQLKKLHGIQEIYFDDSLFTIPRAKEIAQCIIDNHVKIAFSCWVDWRIKLEELELLKKAGCIAIKFGIESGNRQIMEDIGKNNHIDHIRAMIKTCKRMGFLVHASFMLGLPNETKQSLQDTIDLAFSLGLNSCQFSIATPLPGTPFYDTAKKNGWLVTDDWAKFESYHSCVVQYDDCTPEDILAAFDVVRRKKVKQFLSNPAIALSYFAKMYRMKGFREFSRDVAKKGAFALSSFMRKDKAFH
jgi:radical SAM superfamily enzyme YgiQ (UPF0313 family)